MDIPKKYHAFRSHPIKMSLLVHHTIIPLDCGIRAPTPNPKSSRVTLDPSNQYLSSMMARPCFRPVTIRVSRCGTSILKNSRDLFWDIIIGSIVHRSIEICLWRVLVVRINDY